MSPPWGQECHRPGAGNVTAREPPLKWGHFSAAGRRGGVPGVTPFGRGGDIKGSPRINSPGGCTGAHWELWELPGLWCPPGCGYPASSGAVSQAGEGRGGEGGKTHLWPPSQALNVIPSQSRSCKRSRFLLCCGDLK